MQVKSGTQRRFGIPVKSLEGLLSKKKQGRTFRIKIYKNVRTGLKAAAHERKNKPRITENSKHAEIIQRRWQKTTKTIIYCTEIAIMLLTNHIYNL